MLSDLEQSILKTLCFFDLFEYPLTEYEIWKWIKHPHPVSMNQVLQTLEKLVRHHRIRYAQGFYFLPKSEKFTAERRRRYRDAEAKWSKAVRASKWLARCPFIQMVAIGNTLSYSNSRPQADIDFFVVTQPGRIWTARFVATLFFHLLGKRPTATHTADAICLSFWVTQDALDLTSTTIHDQDLYLQYWIAQLIPVFDPTEVYTTFFRANQKNLKVFPHIQAMKSHTQRKIKLNRTQQNLKYILEHSLQGRLGKWMENLFRTLQLRRLPSNLKHQMNQNKGVVINDHMLKFHDKDRRQEFFEQWQKKYEQQRPTVLV